MSNLAHSIVARILQDDPTPLDAVPRFFGASVYALYYVGDHPAYEPIATPNRFRDDEAVPLYVGKAVPKGGRQGLDNSTHGHTRFG